MNDQATVDIKLISGPSVSSWGIANSIPAAALFEISRRFENACNTGDVEKLSSVEGRFQWTIRDPSGRLVIKALIYSFQWLEYLIKYKLLPPHSQERRQVPIDPDNEGWGIIGIAAMNQAMSWLEFKPSTLKDQSHLHDALVKYLTGHEGWTWDDIIHIWKYRPENSNLNRILVNEAVAYVQKMDGNYSTDYNDSFLKAMEDDGTVDDLGQAYLDKRLIAELREASRK